MSLFIGNIANVISAKELEEIFSKYGKCTINYKGAFAFAEYEVEKEAKLAKEQLHNKQINGRLLNIEWSKKSNNYEGKHGNDPSSRGKCYFCGRSGHYARDCPEERRRSNSRRRYHSRRRYIEVDQEVIIIEENIPEPEVLGVGREVIGKEVIEDIEVEVEK